MDLKFLAPPISNLFEPAKFAVPCRSISVILPFGVPPAHLGTVTAVAISSVGALLPKLPSHRMGMVNDISEIDKSCQESHIPWTAHHAITTFSSTLLRTSSISRHTFSLVLAPSSLVTILPGLWTSVSYELHRHCIPFLKGWVGTLTLQWPDFPTIYHGCRTLCRRHRRWLCHLLRWTCPSVPGKV